jgi:DNA sulfur modification protein DndE
VDTLRLNGQAKNHLAKLRRHSGLPSWNILCRWAFCLSLAESTQPPRVRAPKSGTGIEMTWKVLAGQLGPVFMALLVQDAHNSGRDSRDSSVVAALARDHIQRGLGYLAGLRRPDIESIIELVEQIESET